MINDKDLDAIKTKPLNRDNASFEMKNGLLYATIDGECSRVFLNLAFPYETHEEYVSVLDAGLNERGMILSLKDIAEDDRELVVTELKRRYFTPKIKSVYSMQEKNGYAYWDVATDTGRVTFTVRDNFKNILKTGADSAIIYDNDGNRFIIESISALDKKSHRKIELYL